MTQPDLARTAAELTLDLHPIGGALTDAATHLAELNDLLPTRGDARHEFLELAKVIAYITTLYRTADEHLTETAYLLQHHQDVPEPLPLTEPIDTIRAIESGAQTPGKANPPQKGDPMASPSLTRHPTGVSTP